jgi:hypothetical protein
VLTPLLATYLAGVVFGVWRTDGPPLVKLGLSVLWPIGAVAFVLTITLLLAASLIAFPLAGLLVAAAVALWLLT